LHVGDVTEFCYVLTNTDLNGVKVWSLDVLIGIQNLLMQAPARVLQAASPLTGTMRVVVDQEAARRMFHSTDRGREVAVVVIRDRGS
jgi:hypothetical protein